MFKLAEEALDQIALSVDALVDRTVDDPLSCRRDMGFGAAGSDQIEERIGIVTSIGDDVAAFEAFEQEGCGAQVMGLAGGQHEPHWQPIFIDQGVDFGAQSSTRTTDGVIFAPFFPPAACWWALMIELSINAIECGDLAANVSNTRTQTPARAQRLNRL
jgi:hypothetical protein